MDEMASNPLFIDQVQQRAGVCSGRKSRALLNLTRARLLVGFLLTLEHAIATQRTSVALQHTALSAAQSDSTLLQTQLVQATGT